MNAQLLLVEDDDAVADVVTLHMLQAGYGVHREADGRRAMQALDQARWDLLLLDLMLPGADGLDVCRHARSRPGWLPIIMISARSAETQRVLGLELGADDFLAKPFSMMELSARVRALLRRVQQMKQPPADGVALTLREFDLLQFLLRHPGQVFTRAQLLQQVWGEGFEGFEHTVNSHINRLRNKIEAEPQDPRLITTVWGVGYRFEPPA
jgi:DNA-binding response OmpR family regulator